MFAGRSILSVAKKLLKNDKITTASKRLVWLLNTLVDAFGLTAQIKYLSTDQRNNNN
jgi:hypothetical protein